MAHFQNKSLPQIVAGADEKYVQGVTYLNSKAGINYS